LRFADGFIKGGDGVSALIQWAFALCAAMVAMGLCRMLIPSSSMEKTFRFVVSIFFLTILLSPVAIRFPSLMIDTPPQTQAEIEQRSANLDEITRQQALRMAQGRLRQITREKLSQKGIIAHSIAINFTTNLQGEILLESVVITLDATHQESESDLISYLESELGGTVLLHYV